MFALFTENENSEKPPERESEPSGDGSPERSPTPRANSAAQAKLVADDTEAFEDQQTGVAISYRLDEKETYRYLRYDGFYSPAGLTIFAIASVLAILALVCFVIGGWVLFLVGMAVLFVAVQLLRKPIRSLHRYAHGAANNGGINLKIYPDHIDARCGKGKETLEIPLDGTTECARVHNFFGLYFQQKDKPEQQKPLLLLVPIHGIDAAVLPDVEAMILSGTKPKKLRKNAF